MQILLTNDDGIYAPGLRALEKTLPTLGDVTLCAPATEQSGVGHGITFLTPLTAKEVFEHETRRGWAIDGTPADCVKLGIAEFCPQRPELVVSGINAGSTRGSMCSTPDGIGRDRGSVLRDHEHCRITRIRRTRRVRSSRRYRDARDSADLGAKAPGSVAYNINIPTSALSDYRGVRVVPMGVRRWGEAYEKRFDPKGRPYYWAANETPPEQETGVTDVTCLAEGYVTVTPLHFDLTRHADVAEMQRWLWK